MFSSDEVLVGAKHLLELDGVEIAEDVTKVEYFHILFDRQEVIFSNGAETESLYTGRQALKALGPVAREEIFALFPDCGIKPKKRSAPLHDRWFPVVRAGSLPCGTARIAENLCPEFALYMCPARGMGEKWGFCMTETHCS